MTIDIVDIEKLREIKTADEFIGCHMEHVLRENEHRKCKKDHDEKV